MPKSPRLLILGDSTSAGYGASSQAKGYAPLVGKALKWKTDISAVRGTGYTWGGLHGGKDDYGTRIKAIIKKNASKPNVIVLEGSQYDYRSVSKITGAVKKDVQLLRNAYPQAAIVLFGPAGPTSLQSRLKPIDAADQAAATALNVPYISPYQEHWLTSKNAKLFTKGRLNTAGHAYVAKRFLSDFKPLFGL